MERATQSTPEALRILLVEDNPGDARLVRELLGDAAQVRFTVVHVADLTAALQIPRGEGFDAVLLDLGLHETQVIATLEAAHGIFSTLPILVLTGIDDEELALAAMRGGAQDYLIKDQLDTPLLTRAIRYAVERKRTNRALREREELYRTLVETSPDAITLCEPDGTIVRANRSAAKIHGCASTDALTGKSLFELVAEEDRARARAHCAVLLDSGLPASDELTLLQMSGTRFAGELNTSLVHDESGQPLAIIAIGRDITERKRSYDDARRLDKLESLSILAGGVAHDFNNLLTAVITNLSMARDDVRCDGETAESLKEAAYAAKRARSLTRQLLTFAKGGAPIKKSASVGELLESTAGFVLRGSTCRADYQIPRDLWAAEIDQDQMSQVIENLVINASQAMAGGGSIEIGARNLVLEEGSPQRPALLAPGKYIAISIRDFGVGIPEQLLGNVFDPYFTTKQDGSGLGLAVAYAVVKKHGGHIAVETEAGTGTEFTILLPASERSNRQSAKLSLMPVRGSGRVLVMDDDPLIQRSLKRMLTRLGYTVEVSPDGEDAIARYRDGMSDGHAFDAVIMDLTVPGGMGGVEAIERLRRIDPDVKAIVSSGYSTDQVMSDHEHYGFAAVVTKPYDIEDMAMVLNELICGAPQELEATK